MPRNPRLRLPPRRRPGPRRRPPAVALGARPRRGAALAEALVAAAVLAVGALATAGLAAVAARDLGRARAADAALALVRERVAVWQEAPCAAAAIRRRTRGSPRAARAA